jgi:uncharacterized Fe-S center protein
MTAKVYFTRQINPESLISAYDAMGWTPTGKVGVKLSTGEAGNTHYLDPQLIKDLVHKINGTIVECNTAYAGARNTTEAHRKLAEEHGFTAIADVDIMDADGSMSLPVVGGDTLPEDLVGTHFKNYDSFLVLSHFKGHGMGGFGGALKNISIGFASSEGKNLIHAGGKPGRDKDDEHLMFLRCMAEADKAIMDAMGSKIAFVNVMNKMSVDCDCDGNAGDPVLPDMGILSSTDPVAVDQAAFDMIWRAPKNSAMIERIMSRNGLNTIEHAAEIGVGTRDYELIDLDK